MDWIALGSALALVLVIEGLLPAIVPDQWRRMLLVIAERDSQSLRRMGLTMILLGLAALWLVRS